MRVLLIFSLFVVGERVRAHSDFLRFYSSRDCRGQSRLLQGHLDRHRNLNKIIENNEIRSVRLTGVWLLYQLKNYNEYIGMVYVVHGNNITKNLPSDFPTKLSSIRRVRRSSLPMLTLYERDDYAGKELTVSDNRIQLHELPHGKANSLIMTGDMPWTIVTKDHGKTNSACVYPDVTFDPDTDGQVKNLGFYPNTESMGLSGSVVAVIAGCTE
ncbi:uncharacterized protein LOC135103294 [Scylla paramamosain]|uniref:uncharacterized protein LOC135103294 n=1 Tax=Scylla paramamosain TaxID=85552 RepID=UPI0030837569